VSAIEITAADSFQSCHRMATVYRCLAACSMAEYSATIRTQLAIVHNRDIARQDKFFTQQHIPVYFIPTLNLVLNFTLEAFHPEIITSIQSKRKKLISTNHGSRSMIQLLVNITGIGIILHWLREAVVAVSRCAFPRTLTVFQMIPNMFAWACMNIVENWKYFFWPTWINTSCHYD